MTERSKENSKNEEVVSKNQGDPTNHVWTDLSIKMEMIGTDYNQLNKQVKSSAHIPSNLVCHSKGRGTWEKGT